MSDFTGEGIGRVVSQESAEYSPYRGLWHLPDDLPSSVDPRKCFERTAENTSIKYIGSKDPLPATSFLFSIPIYHREWTQGNLQKLLYNFLERDYSDQVGAVELNFLLNELSNDRDTSRDPSAYNILEKFNLDKKDFFSDKYDFSSMTHKEYIQYRHAEHGRYISYPENLRAGIKNLEYMLTQNYFSAEQKEKIVGELAEERIKVASIIQTNEQIRSFLSAVIEAQRLGRRLFDHGSNPIVYQETINEIANLIDRYKEQPDLQKLIQLAYAKSDKVNISLLDLLETDFLAEGYRSKNLAHVRCVGADYALERTKYLPHSPKIIYQMWDADLLPSGNFMDELKKFYDREDIDITWLPVGMLISPGTTTALFETSLNQGMVWTHTEPYYFGSQSTPKLSFRLAVLKELNGIIGDPPGGGIDEDRKTGWRLVRYMYIAESDKYAREFKMPPIVTLMHDRPGYMDGLGREKGDQGNKEFPVDYWIDKFLSEPEFYIFKNTENLIEAIDSMKAKRTVQVDIEKDAAESGVSLSIFLQQRPDLQTTYQKNYYDAELFQKLEELSTNNTEYKEAQTFFNDAVSQYFSEYEKLAKLNRMTVKAFIRQRKAGNIIQNERGEMDIIDIEKVPEAVKFHLINYLKSNSHFLSSLTEDDWAYTEYLVSESDDGIRGPLNRTQQVLREYLGEVVNIPKVLEGKDSYVSCEKREVEDKKSYLYATYAMRLAVSLTVRNFLYTPIKKQSREAKAEYGTGTIQKLEPIMADYEDRVKGIRQALSL